MPARFVVDDAFYDSGGPFYDIQGYITADMLSFTAPDWVGLSAGVVSLNWKTADLIAIVAGGPITHQVYRAEIRSWFPGADYSRGYIGPIIGPLPAPCSNGYAEEYRYGLGGPGFNVLTRTSPTTWTDGTYTLTAEVTPGITCSCVSLWTFTDGTDLWQTAYNGSAAPGLFSAVGGASPALVWIYPV